MTRPKRSGRVGAASEEYTSAWRKATGPEQLHGKTLPNMHNKHKTCCQPLLFYHLTSLKINSVDSAAVAKQDFVLVRRTGSVLVRRC